MMGLSALRHRDLALADSIIISQFRHNAIQLTSVWPDDDDDDE